MNDTHICGHHKWNDDKPHYLIALYNERADGSSGYTRFWHAGFTLWCSEEKAPTAYSALRSLDNSPLSGFTVTCQSDSDGLSRHDEPRTQPYGWEYGIERSGPVTLEAMQQALPYLRKISAKLEKLAEDAGPCASYGAYVQRIAVALGVSVMVNKHTPRSGWANENASQLRDRPAKDIAWFIDNNHTAWAESVAPNKAVTA